MYCRYVAYMYIHTHMYVRKLCTDVRMYVRTYVRTYVHEAPKMHGCKSWGGALGGLALPEMFRGGAGNWTSPPRKTRF